MDGDLSFPMVLAWAAPFFVLTVTLEWVLVRRGRLQGRYEWKDALTSMTMGLGNLITDILFGFISLGFLLWLWQFRFIDLGISLPIILAALVAQDFVYYWKHRASHRIRWFWSAHVVHHSSQHYNLSTALRQPWNSNFTGYVLLSSPLILIGFHPLLIGFVGALNLLYQYWIHTEAIRKFPRWVEFIFNTPSHHRVHHSTHPTHLDMNYAGIFIIWDRMFGTFVEEGDDEVMTYGLVKNIGTYNPFRVAFSEWISIFEDALTPGLTLRQRLGYIFAPPGYSHDGSRQGSEAILAAWKADNEAG
ncbi:sterol desaturase family protein [Algimonas porphyrae]|uniref:Fatty acid hydroxylase n=1 Tax=Algimonas porphyrae TaxID=1128113 RepID=A0ABQ5UZI1_9PROT|nr:sterol desaturase family protein [Algimonas porphyrae]GLQ19791.1 fatty acid hydroxylase [Algimonas porphyrae]